MVELDPNIQILCHIRNAFSRGEGLLECIRSYSRENRNILAQQLALLLISHQQNKKMYDFVHTQSVERKMVLDIIWRSLRGEQIWQHLVKLETELEERAHRRLDQFSQTLPIKVLLVILFFQFPALLILGLLPILEQILEVTK